MKYLYLTLSALLLTACAHIVKPVNTTTPATDTVPVQEAIVPTANGDAATTDVAEPTEAELQEKFAKLFPDMTDTFTYTAPDGFTCNTAGTTFTGKYVNCENADKSVTMRLGTLPYLGDIQDIQSVADYVSSNLAEEGATVTDTKVGTMDAKKIAAKVKMADQDAFMTSYIFDKNNVAYTINMIETTPESTLGDTFDAFVQAIKVADKPVEKVNLEDILPTEEPEVEAGEATIEIPTEK